MSVCPVLSLLFEAWLGGIDLLSLDGRLAVRCSNTTLPCREVKRFIRVARWVYKATGCKCVCSTQTLEFGASPFHILNLHLRDKVNHQEAFFFLPLWCEAANCTLVTSSLRLVDKRARSWLQRSSAQLRGITRTTMKRRGLVKQDGSGAEDDSTFDFDLVFYECFTKFLTIQCPHCTYYCE